MAPENENKVPDFTLDNDGNFSIPVDYSAENNEGGEIDSVTAIVTGKVNKTKTDSGNQESKSPEISSQSVLADGGRKETPQEITEIPGLNDLQTENSSLRNRIQQLEEKFNAGISAATEQEREIQAQEFREEISGAVADIFGESLDDTQKTKLIEVIEKVSAKKAENAQSQIQNVLNANEQAAQEIRQVLNHYNGKDGKPTIVQMENLVNWVSSNFKAPNGNDIRGEYPAATIFRAAENVPFIMFIKEKYPEQFSKLTFPQLCVASDEVRKAYYRGKSGSQYQHLFDDKSNNSQANNGESVSDLKETANNLSSPRGVGISAESSTIVNKKPQPITSARQAAEEALNQLGVR